MGICTVAMQGFTQDWTVSSRSLWTRNKIHCDHNNWNHNSIIKRQKNCTYMVKLRVKLTENAMGKFRRETMICYYDHEH